MLIKEYQVKKIFKKHGVPLLRGGVAYTPEEARRVAEEIGGKAWVVKAQILAGSRSAGRFLDGAEEELSGIAWANSPMMAAALAEQMLGRYLQTPETGGIYHEVQRVYVEEACLGQGEYQMSLRIDFLTQKLILTIVSAGNMLHRYELPGYRLDVRTERRVLRELRLKDGKADQMADLLRRQVALFEAYGAIAVEFDPVIETAGGFVVLDGRIVFDSDSLFRYPEVAGMIEIEAGREREAAARQHQFRYIHLEGNIACLVNGIGLGQATIDSIHRNGGQVACLLDIGTEPSQDAVARALKMALSDPDIDGVLVNIFGGITRCDEIAEGLIAASGEILAGLPVVVRMDGTNAHIGRRLLFESRLPFAVVQKMDEAVRTIIQQVREVS